MNDSELNILKKYNQGFWVFLSFSIILLLIIIMIFIFRKRFLGNQPQLYKKAMLYIVLSLLLIFNFFIGYRFSLYAKDYTDIKNRTFYTVSGKVVGYSRGTYFENGTTEYSGPIILIDDSSEQIILHVKGTKLNKHYNFIYLKHTKIAEIAN